MSVLVLGGYGLIGEAIVDRLVAEGASVTALGRDVVQASRRKPQVLWIQSDIARLTEPAAWMVVLDGIDVVVNAAGALQDGARDDVRAVHETSMRALYAACIERGIRRVVQISAVGVSPDADTAFLRTKAAGDAALAASGLDHVILRPGLVIGPGAYGGTALLRALAGFPLVTPLVLAERPVQTVGVADVAEAAARAVAGKFPSGTAVDLVEDRGHSLADLVAAFRAWLGFSPARTVTVPAWIGAMTARIADALGWLGWRSPLRTTAMRAVTGGVVGYPAPYRDLTGEGIADLAATLAALPSPVQERWFARMWLLKPAVLGTLSLFWLVSGLIGLFRFDGAAEILTARGGGAGLAEAAVLLGSLADIALGLAVLVCRTARAALTGMIAVTLAYLVGATLLAPDLWLDPLGAMVKSIPAMLLALVGLAVLEER